MNINEQMTIFGRNIKRMRIEQKISQAELVQKSGVSANTISRIENGHDTSFSNIVKILDALNSMGQIPLLSTPQSDLINNKNRRVRKSNTDKQTSRFKWGDE